jgi:hypothetical protein
VVFLCPSEELEALPAASAAAQRGAAGQQLLRARHSLARPQQLQIKASPLSLENETRPPATTGGGWQGPLNTVNLLPNPNPTAPLLPLYPKPLCPCIKHWWGVHLPPFGRRPGVLATAAAAVSSTGRPSHRAAEAARAGATAEKGSCSPAKKSGYLSARTHSWW